LAGRGVPYLDATVAGSSEQVRAGEAVVLLGGDRAAGAACVDLFACFAREWFHLGPWGSGARMKLVVNLVLGLHRAALAEGLAFARACGLDLPETLRVLRAGPARSQVMDTKGRKMIEGDFTPQARLSQHLKDVRLILAEAGRVGARVPLSLLHAELLGRLEAAGWGEEDNAAVFRAFQ
jgi:3-hydroxyisobutyrate dehydrogenase-like beta-hydroxyacid dehydrogenase